MGDGRILSTGQPIPLAVAVTDTNYCFPVGGGTASGSAVSNLKLLCAGRERCLAGYHVDRTEFDCLLVELVVEGDGKVRIDGRVSELFPGVAFLYGMNTPHDVWSSAESPMVTYFAAFSLDGTLDDVGGGTINFGIRWTRDLSAMGLLFEEMIREGKRGGQLHEVITARYLELILLKTAEALPANRVPSPKQNGGRNVIERALACIEGDYQSIARLDDLAECVGVDANYLCRLFKRYGDETPVQCLTRHKINRAAELLVTEVVPILEVARTVGYEDPYYFSRVFKKRFGRSPTEFRGDAS